ncbi:MAG: hypothetical protein H0V78_14055 [Burkholderiales bacterium]|nr:hypothetical protein [Burkholderiales bacterium]
MKTSRPLLALLVLLLLFAQQGAAAHGISHVADAAQQEQQLPYDQFCDQCSAYAQLPGAPQSGPAIALVADIGAIFVTPAARFYTPLVALAFSSRAPPSVL